MSLQTDLFNLITPNIQFLITILNEQDEIP